MDLKGPPPVLWVTENGRLGADAPHGAIAVDAKIAAAWLKADPVPKELAQYRNYGARAAASRTASKDLRSVARRLQSRLSPQTPARLAVVAAALDLPDLAAALQRWPDSTALDYSALAAAAAHPEAPLRSVTARLLKALENL